MSRRRGSYDNNRGSSTGKKKKPSQNKTAKQEAKGAAAPANFDSHYSHLLDDWNDEAWLMYGLTNHAYANLWKPTGAADIFKISDSIFGARCYQVSDDN